MDRASGSGVFARDPDAMLDLIELDVTDDLRKQEQNKTVCATCQTYLDSSPYYLGNMSKNSTPAGTGVVGKIYYAQIYSGDTLVADMIPVKKSDGTPCLYDKVRKKYIYNDGTGTLKEG